ncbi:Uncharacterised protein [Nocardia africana]|uniref:Uncharacterized protein n=1 Tax=Nocardia africana TaxID=134964 RepID=A0A378WPM5_9NOCA|nr:hypothetical protein [Nocardia africana]SUA42374.1 Uncharacterised protein [Nocardia africana]
MRIAAITIEPIATIHRSAGYQSGVRSSRTKVHIPAAAGMRPKAARAERNSRPRHSSTTAMPTSAAIAGAEATV